EGEVDRQVERRRRPRCAVDDADEEVRREKRAEEPDLRRDEEEHAEDARRDARRVVRLRRVVLVVVLDGLGVARQQTPASTGRSDSTWSTGRLVSARSRPSRSRRSQPERAFGKVETMISSTRSSSIVCITAEYGSGCEICPCTSNPSPRSRFTARSSRFSAAS